MSRIFRTLVLGLSLCLAGTALAEKKPAVDVSPQKHPNLAAAQKLSRQAFDKIVAAQHANEWDMKGHAEKAKALLDEVNTELKLAAEAANAAHK